MSFEESPAERAIREAMERGVFDNLPGKGMPLPPPDDVFTPPDMKLVYRILKNAGVAPEWVQVHDDIEHERAAVSALWTRMEAEYPRRRRTLEPPNDRDDRKRAFAEWHADRREELERSMRRVNSAILSLNLKAPAGTHPQIPFKVDEEMARFDAAFPGLPGVTVERHEEPQRREPEEVLRNVLAARWSRRK